MQRERNSIRNQRPTLSMTEVLCLLALTTVLGVPLGFLVIEAASGMLWR
ncbi:hypothetical protein ACFSM5_21005 [Lacibacterium aquatile]|uniref:Uncharacterized protein n=1 Tax=Lacibacterium aquatile TaxID=1168082 RepID=A0ABW5DXY9_9PROT